VRNGALTKVVYRYSIDARTSTTEEGIWQLARLIELIINARPEVKALPIKGVACT
jgi:hypothetical protein